MASYEDCKTVSLVAGGDLRGAFAEALTIDSSGQVVKTANATSHCIGALAEDPARDTTGLVVPVAVVGGGGVLKIKAGATITAGQLVVPSVTEGRVAGVADVGALADDQMAIGIALEEAADGQIFSLLAQVIAGPHVA